MSILSFFLKFFSRDIAMDLGTANTLLYTRSGGIVVNEPSIVSIDAESGELLAVGADARRAHGRTPRGIRTVRPLRCGVIADFDVTERMIVSFIRKAMGGGRGRRPAMTICVPTGITQVEKKAVIDAGSAAGAVRVSLIEEPMAAAIGGDLPVTEARGTLVADIGGGTSEVACITLSAIALSHSVRVAGDVMNEAVQLMLRRTYGLEVGENTAEAVKIGIGSAVPMEGLEPMEVSGKDLTTGIPTTVRVSPDDVRAALVEPIEEIAGAVQGVLEKLPPELAADIYDSGLWLAGGGSLLRGLDVLLAERTKLTVRLVEEPLTAVLRGTAKVMLEPETYGGVCIS